METLAPYFLVRFELLTREGVWVDRSELYWKLPDLIQMNKIPSEFVGFRLNQLAIIKPSIAKESWSWEMAEIDEVQVNDRDTDDPSVVVYKTKCGQKIVVENANSDIPRCSSLVTVLSTNCGL